MREIINLLDESLNLVLFRLLMEQADTREESKYNRKILQNWLDLETLRENYTNLFITKNNHEINICTWFSENFYTVVLEPCSKWESIRFKKEKALQAMFIGFFINLLQNALNYGKKSHEEGWLKIRFDNCTIENKDFLTIEFSNPSQSETAYEEGSGNGLSYMQKSILNLNQCIYPENTYSLTTRQNNGIFCVKLYFAEKLFIRKE